MRSIADNLQQLGRIASSCDARRVRWHAQALEDDCYERWLGHLAQYGEPLVHYGPFAAGSVAEIEEIFHRYRAGRFESMSAIARRARRENEARTSEART